MDMLTSSSPKNHKYHHAPRIIPDPFKLCAFQPAAWEITLIEIEHSFAL
jgi:hypothetical protein